MARQARRAANLVPGASLRGLVFDGCYDNRIPHTFGMLRHFGMHSRNRVLVSESPHLNIAGLATALRIDESEVLSRRYGAVGRGHRDFFGLLVMKSRIEDRVRRFSPAAIAKGLLHHPATHELRDLPFSTVGWDMLRDTCPCEDDGVRQNWVTSNGSSRCHSCGGSLGRVGAVPVPENLKPALGLIAGLVDPDPAEQDAAVAMLPAAIRRAGRTLLYDLVMNLARAIGTDAQEADPLARTEALARACNALIAWPTGLDGIGRPTGCPTHIWEWVRRTYAILDGTGTGTGAAPGSGTQVAINTHAPIAAGSTCTSPGLNPTYAPSGSKGRLRTTLISAMAAARLGGVDESALKQAWDDGRLTPHVWVLGPTRVRAFDPAEVVRIAPGLRVAGSRAAAASRLGTPVYGVEQLLEAELLVPAIPGGGVKQLRAHLDAADALATRVEDGSTTVADAPIPFVDAIRHVSGRPKPWAAAIGAMLNGKLPFEVRGGTGGRALATRIVVGREAIAVIGAMRDDLPPKVTIERADRWSGVDALECLNGNRSASQLLGGIECAGSGKRKLLPVDKVLERAATGVTTFDLTRRSGIGTTRIAARLDANHVGQIAPGLWERTRAEELTLLPGSW